MTIDANTLEKCMRDGTPVKLTLNRGGRYVYGRVRKIDNEGSEPRITIKVVRSNLQAWRLRKPKFVFRASEIKDIQERYEAQDFQPNLKLGA